jgi:hypothetical protein
MPQNGKMVPCFGVASSYQLLSVLGQCFYRRILCKVCHVCCGGLHRHVGGPNNTTTKIKNEFIFGKGANCVTKNNNTTFDEYILN